MYIYNLKPHWSHNGSSLSGDGGSLSGVGVVRVPESLPGEKYSGSGNMLRASMHSSLPGFKANNYITSAVVREDEACGVVSSTVTPTPDERVYAVSSLEVNAAYEVNDSLPPPPARSTYTNEVTIDVVSSEGFGVTTSSTSVPTGNSDVASGFSPWSVSATTQERPPHSWTTVSEPPDPVTITYHCQDGEIVYSEEIDVGWLAGKVDGILATKSSEIESAFALGNSLGSSSGSYTFVSARSESQSRNGSYQTSKVASYTEAYATGSNAAAWNGEYYHVRGWQTRSLKPALYIKPTYAYAIPPTGTAVGIDLYAETERVATLSEEITHLRRDIHGVWDVSDDYLPLIPYLAGNLYTGYGLEAPAKDLRFFSLTGRKYRLHTSDGDVLTGFVETPTVGVSAPWDGLVSGMPFYEFYKVEEWSETSSEWVVIGVNEWANYWYLNPGELETIEAAWVEAGVTNQYSGNFVSGSILTVGVKVIVFGRSRVGNSFGHRGFTNPDTRFRTQTTTGSRVSKYAGVSGTMEGSRVSSYDDNGNASETYEAEGIMEGVTWFDETSTPNASDIVKNPSSPYSSETNTERRSTYSPTITPESGNEDIKFNFTGAGRFGRVLSTTEDVVAAPTVDIVGGSNRVRSATTAPPVVAAAGEEVELAYVRVTRQP